ncbi:unnamed protein product [Rhizophagus irregularis]|nr:unnamed protein product [Rhizophagus irregularis]
MCDTVILIPLHFAHLMPPQYLMVLYIIINGIGIFILLSGVLVLSWKRSTAPEEDLLTGEDRRLLGQDVEGLTELYDDDDFGDFEDNIDLDSSEYRLSFEGNSSTTTGMFTFEEMIDDDDDADEKTSLLGKRSIGTRSTRSNKVT